VAISLAGKKDEKMSRKIGWEAKRGGAGNGWRMIL